MIKKAVQKELYESIESKLQYFKGHGFVEFDKEEIKEELIKKGVKQEKALEMVTKYKYFRIMSDGNKMFYSEEYIQNHTIQELEEKFAKMD